jgi:hypothetical protein
VRPNLSLPQRRATSDTGCQAQLLAAYVFLVAHPVFQIPTNKPVPCPWLIVVGEAIKEVCVSRLSLVPPPLTSPQMIYRKDLINDVATCQLFATYPLTANAMQAEWVKWAEYESRKRLGPMVGIYIMRF